MDPLVPIILFGVIIFLSIIAMICGSKDLTPEQRKQNARWQTEQREQNARWQQRDQQNARWQTEQREQDARWRQRNQQNARW